MKIQKRTFTLLEIIIAVSIFMLIALTLYAYSRETVNSWRRIIAERNRFSELLVLDRTINNILDNVIPFTWPDPDGVKTPFIVAERDYLRCAYMHRLNDEIEGALRFGEFIIENNNLLLAYSDRPYLDWNDTGDRRKVSTLAKEIESIDFLYADWSADDSYDWQDRILWLDHWETENSERKDVPLAIKITVNWLDGRTETWLRRTMGSSYRERFGKWEPLPEDKR